MAEEMAFTFMNNALFFKYGRLAKWPDKGRGQKGRGQYEHEYINIQQASCIS